MPPRTAVTANDLVTWASTRQAQELFPVLLRRLIHATGQQLRRVGLPAYESVHLGGWDGIVVAEGPDVKVPLGLSAWEFGVTDDVGSKANADYKKRTENPLGVAPEDTTFVFVTPRRWSRKEVWAAEHAAEARWREVRAYDADDLEQWLERAPAPLTARLQKALTAHVLRFKRATYPSVAGPDQPSPWVFHHLSTRRHAVAGGRIASLYGAFKSAAERAGLPRDLHQHDLRHRRVTTWIAQGKDVALVKEAMGHADLRTTMAYTHLAKEHLRALVEPARVPAAPALEGSA